MGLHAYRAAVELHRKDVPFDALIMAAMIKADSFNIEYLRRHWPQLWVEVEQRWHLPGGMTPEEWRATYLGELYLLWDSDHSELGIEGLRRIVVLEQELQVSPWRPGFPKER